MKNMQQALKQAQLLKDEMMNKNKEFETKTVVQDSGGGLVKVKMTYKGKLEEIEIDPSLLNLAEKEVLEDLIVAAINSAKEEGDKRMANELGQITGSLGLPSGFNLPF